MELQWPLILFTTFVSWSAGLFGAQGLYALKGAGGKTQLRALIVSLVLLVVGGICVFFHLQHWERIFNGFGHITSGITQELIAIVITVIIMVVYYINLRRNNDGTVSKSLSISAICIALILVIVCGHSYMMSSRPGWDTFFQALSLVGAACALGPLTMATLAILSDDVSSVTGNIRTGLIGNAVNTVTTVAYIIALAVTGNEFTQVGEYFDPTGPTRGMIDVTALTPFSSSSLPVTILAIIAAAAGLLAALRGNKTGNWKLWGTIGLTAVLLGVVLLRILFYQMGASVYVFTDL